MLPLYTLTTGRFVSKVSQSFVRIKSSLRSTLQSLKCVMYRWVVLLQVQTRRLTYHVTRRSRDPHVKEDIRHSTFVTLLNSSRAALQVNFDQLFEIKTSACSLFPNSSFFTKIKSLPQAITLLSHRTIIHFSKLNSCCFNIMEFG